MKAKNKKMKTNSASKDWAVQIFLKHVIKISEC